MVSVGAYWCLWVPNGVCGCLLVSEGAYWCLWVRIHGLLTHASVSDNLARFPHNHEEEKKEGVGSLVHYTERHQFKGEVAVMFFKESYKPKRTGNGFVLFP